LRHAPGLLLQKGANAATKFRSGVSAERRKFGLLKCGFLPKAATSAKTFCVFCAFLRLFLFQ
jgi:hypothetical protein